MYHALVVEDAASQAKVITAILSSARIACVTCADGAEALSYLQAHRPDLVLLDIELPDMNGFEVCARLRDMPRGEDIPVLFVSTRATAADKAKAFEAGGDDYIVKPFSSQELLVRARNLIGRPTPTEVVAEARQAGEDRNDLAANRQRIEFALSASGLAVWEWRAGSDMLRASGPFADMLGMPLTEDGTYPVRPIMDRIHPDDRPRHEQIMRAILKRETEQAEFMSRMRRDDDSYVTQLIRATLLPQGDHEAPVLLGVVVDMTEQEQMGKTLAMREQQFHSLFDQSPIGIALLDLEGHLKQVNTALCEMLAYTRDELLQMSVLDITHPDDRGKNDDLFQELIAGKRDDFTYEKRYRGKNGNTVWVSTNVFLGYDVEANPFIIGMAQDITERVLAEQTLYKMANYQVITNLPNANMLRGELATRNSLKQNYQLLLLDLDHFADINHSFGHTVGDLVLVQVTDRLKPFCDDTGAMLFHMRGDEFALLIRGLDGDAVAIQVRDLLQQPLLVNELRLFVTASIGIVNHGPQSNVSPEELIRQADAAVFAVKKDGRDGIRVYDASMTASVRERMDMQTRMHAALDAGEFQPYFQLQVSCEDEKPRGAEALLRWLDPEAGMISPARFIPLAEESGFILSLGDYVIDQALRTAKTWFSGGLLPGRVSINLSVKQFRDEDLVDRIGRMLSAHDVDPSLVEFEITESVLSEDVGAMIRRLRHLKRLGCHLALDDFGTGYSSLSYLSQLPIDVLKLDKSFVDALAYNDPTKTRILANMIRMASDIGLETVAEGVESRAQFEWLCRAGCTRVQGFAFYKPLPSEEVQRILTAS